MKKILNVVVAWVLAFSFMASNVSAWTIDDWVTGPGFGSATAINKNVTNLKGAAGEGPYSKSSTQKLEDGISENIHVELDKDDYTHGELFELTVSIENENKEYVNENRIMIQKVGDEFVVTAPIDPNFKATINEDGVYTLQYNVFKKDGKVYTNFKILLWDDVIDSTRDVDFDTVVGPDTKHPITAQKNITTRSVWFCNIQAVKGVNVWTNLPEKPVVPTPVPTPTPDNIPNENPNTYDDIYVYIALVILGFGTLLYAFKKALQ